jgi:hypothetical protein
LAATRAPLALHRTIPDIRCRSIRRYLNPRRVNINISLNISVNINVV